VFLKQGFAKGCQGVPRDENALWRKSFIGGQKFVCTSVNERSVFNYVVLECDYLKIVFNKHGV
jgi:hypothetical protein